MDTVQLYWNKWVELQYSYDCEGPKDWSQTNYWIPGTAVFIYLNMLYFGRKWMATRAPFNMRHAFAMWNLFLSLFSCYGTYYVVPGLLRRLFTKGYYFTICDDGAIWAKPGETEFEGVCYGPVGFWMTLFCLSKVPELFDTFFLVFQKKNVMFLHWYHHVSVLMYCWWAIGHTNPGGLYFGAMNFSVHSVMYFYFFAATYWYKAVRPFAFLITWIQITQMVIGLLTSAAAIVYSWQGSCSETYDIEWKTATSVMYGSYLILFCKLYYDSYHGKKASKKAAAPAKKVQ